MFVAGCLLISLHQLCFNCVRQPTFLQNVRTVMLFEPGMSEAPPLVRRRTFALYAALFSCPFPISMITNGKYIAYHTNDIICVVNVRLKWFPLRYRFCIPSGKAGDPALAVIT